LYTIIYIVTCSSMYLSIYSRFLFRNLPLLFSLASSTVVIVVVVDAACR